MENFKRFETIRHGEKQGENLSEAGVEQTKAKAKEFLDEIERAPEGTVFYIMPSIVGRAVATRDILESELNNLAQEQKSENIEFISVKNTERIGEVKGDMSRKYVITELPPSALLGFKEKTSSIPAFLKFKKLYKNNEDLVGKTWVARPEELASLKERIKQEFPDLDIEGIDPKVFIETPEKAALKYILLMKKVAEITEKHFPGHPYKGLFVGHNLSADFAAMALLGKDISVESAEELGGKFRGFLESSYFEMKDGKICFMYRDQEKEQEKDLNEVIHQLKEASKKRNKGWGVE